MGKQGGAIGFAVYLNELERLNTQVNQWDCDVLILYSKDAPAEMVAQAAEAYRQAGLIVRVEREIPEGLTFREIREVKP